MGVGTRDDAAVYRLSDDLALIQTVDFFPPIVDDPFSFGEIAVANAVSDIYAMGGRPLLGLNIVAFPANLPKQTLVEILKGGASKAREAGLLIVGGHTVDDKEPKYGLAVTGLVRPGSQITNSGAKAGDVLVLTKPIGTGIITTAGKNQDVDERVLAGAVEEMKTLNHAACDAMVKVGVNACTDVTGYGLLGHLRGMVDASGVGRKDSRGVGAPPGRSFGSSWLAGPRRGALFVTSRRSLRRFDGDRLTGPGREAAAERRPDVGRPADLGGRRQAGGSGARA